MKKVDLQALQQELDAKKWQDGTAMNADPCGTYDFCAKCDKSVEFPCAAAKTAFAKSEKPVKARKSAATKEKVEVPTSVKEEPAQKAIKTAVKPRAKKAEKTVDVKPVEVVVEAKPVDVKVKGSVVEIKEETIAAKPVEKVKPAEVKPVEAKPVEKVKPAEVKPVEKLKPVVATVVAPVVAAFKKHGNKKKRK